MYPGEGEQPPRLMTAWEVSHCPWYIEVDKWAVPFDEAEKNCYKLCSKGISPPLILNSMKLGLPEEAEASATKMEKMTGTKFAYVDRTRRPRAKASEKPSPSSIVAKKSE